MKGLRILYCILLLLPLLSTAQDTSIRFGSETEEKKFNTFPIMLGSDGQYFYALRLKNIMRFPGLKVMRGGSEAGKMSLMLLGFARFRSDRKLMEPESYYSPHAEYFLEKYDNSLSLLSQQKIEIPQSKEKDQQVKKVFFLNGKFIAFSTIWYDKEKKTEAGYQFISPEGKMDPSFNVLASIPKSKSNTDDKNTCEFELSPDRSRILFLNYELDEEKQPRKVSVKVLKSDMSEIWNRSFTLNIREKDLDIDEAQVDNNGRVVVLGRIFLEGKEKSENKQKFKYHFLAFNADMKEPSEFEIKPGNERFVSDIKYFFDDKSNIIVTGFYSEKSASKLKGVYYQKVEGAAMSMAPIVTADMDQAFFAEMVGSKKAEKTEELSEFHIREIFPAANGSLTFVAERFFIDATKRSNSYIPDFTFAYNYEDILVFNMTVNASINWVRKIPKKQRTVDDGAFYSSFVCSNSGGTICIVYNAKKEDPNKVMYNPRSAFAYVSTVDPAGNVSTKPLFSAKEEETIMTPKVSLIPSPGKIIVHNIRGTTFKFAEIIFGK